MIFKCPNLNTLQVYPKMTFTIRVYYVSLLLWLVRGLMVHINSKHSHKYQQISHFSKGTYHVQTNLFVKTMQTLICATRSTSKGHGKRGNFTINRPPLNWVITLDMFARRGWFTPDMFSISNYMTILHYFP